ncbi:class-II DAHP synthetase family [Azorhizobium caulinodans ORS 571]|uniref:Class-II DAHP synthetase family n=1 Tax=Azorhizobium caulinodans (strain ATCC 43989 / DSM 5975 / JCM 20966 / LMG 6465 / NBRC 14845 / NCIMB 13405 / ORS 571) TaxID=438753 RepID=A8HTR2_AZOC5|nr:hypothetical protein [Azorhizobium caulinodans]BAF86861.1 class-II DAHP synthetase family [Azorhizobium caulinodans ORS 571]
MIMNIKKFTLFLVLLTLCGCNADVLVDTNFATTPAGMLNSGMGEIGTLYLINAKKMEARRIETIPVEEGAVRNSGSASLEISQLEGFSFTVSAKDGSPTQDQLAKATAALSSQSRLVLTDYSKSEIRAPWEPIVAQLRLRTPTSEIDPWSLDEAIRSNDIFYVFVAGSISAGSARFYIGEKEDSDGNGISLNIEKNLDASIKFTNRSQTAWQGRGVPVIIKLYTFRVTKGANGYRISSARIPNLSGILAKSAASL